MKNIFYKAVLWLRAKEKRKNKNRAAFIII
jgi:hypothetical protein